MMLILPMVFFSVPHIENRLKELKIKTKPGLKINFRPSPEDLQLVFDFGVEFGKKILIKLGRLSVEKAKLEGVE